MVGIRFIKWQDNIFLNDSYYNPHKIQKQIPIHSVADHIVCKNGH